MPAETRLRIKENVEGIRERISAAARRAGRLPSEIRLIGVTKYVGLCEIQALLECDCLDLAESRPQMLWQKSAELAALVPQPVARWHLIGQLQRNKVRRTLPRVHLLHSGDSLDLLREIQSRAQELKKRQPVLLEVNISGDAGKHGFRKEELAAVLDAARPWTHLEIQGLMGMSGLASDPECTRREFSGLRRLAEQVNEECAPEPRLSQLSMGMSDDFEIGVEEGATLVRVGSALFSGVVP